MLPFPGDTVYCYPNILMSSFKLFKMCHMILRAIGLVKHGEMVSVMKIKMAFILLCFLTLILTILVTFILF